MVSVSTLVDRGGGVVRNYKKWHQAHFFNQDLYPWSDIIHVIEWTRPSPSLQAIKTGQWEGLGTRLTFAVHGQNKNNSLT